MAEERKRERLQGFAALGIPVGAVLVYKKDPSITVKTLDDRNKVEYQGRPYSISTLAKKLVGSPVSGYRYFKYGDNIIKSLGKSLKLSPLATPPAAEPASVGDSAGEGIDPLAGTD
jgi:hypothetical protein